MTLQQFRLPDLGEGLTEGEILGWLVAVGDQIALNQPICEVETAKAAVELPSPFAGRVVTLHHPAGTTVDVGSPIITVDTAAERDPVAADPAVPADPPAPGAPEASPGLPVPHSAPDDLVPALPDALDPAALDDLVSAPVAAGRTPVLVGYGPRAAGTRRRPRRPVAAPALIAARAPAAAGPAAGAPAAAAGPVRTKPPVRKLARDLGVDLRAVQGSGTDGLVLRADVTAVAQEPAGPVPVAGREEQRIPVRGIRRLTAQAMVSSAFTAPHVTEFLTCDVTPSMELLTRLRAMPEFAGGAVTPLLLVAKALLLACRRHPGINASWDGAADEIVLHGGVNLGIAASTPRGLVVPNIKDADTLPLAGLAAALAALTATARAGRTSPADMSGGTITITNVGVFGVDAGTPILNPGEAAILCLGAIRDQPWVFEDRLAIRKVTTLALSFDHRLVDGELGSRVLADVGAVLADPTRLIGWQ